MMRREKLQAVLCCQRGQGIIEYSLIMLLISLMTFAALTILGQFTPGVLSDVLGTLH